MEREQQEEWTLDSFLSSQQHTLNIYSYQEKQKEKHDHQHDNAMTQECMNDVKRRTQRLTYHDGQHDKYVLTHRMMKYPIKFQNISLLDEKTIS